jgi:hypothetical protein
MLGAKQEVGVKLDDAILEEIARRGPGTATEIGQRLSKRVYDGLQRLLEAGEVQKSKDDRYGLKGTWPARSPVITRRL